MELTLNDRFHIFSKKGNYVSGFDLFVNNGNCSIRMQKLPLPYFLSSCNNHFDESINRLSERDALDSEGTCWR